MQYIVNALKGIVIGISNVIPGVSGGTIAIILNIYDKIIAIASLKIDAIKKNIKFIIAIVIGMAIGVFGFSIVIKYLFENFNMQTNFFFIGIVLGSIPMIFKRAGGRNIKPISIIPFLAALAVIIILSLLNTGDSTAVINSAMNFGLFMRLLVSSAVAAFAMIIPGISGSFVLLVLGCYGTVISAIPEMNLFVLIPAGIGIIIGIVLGARLVDFLIRKFPQATYMAILGLILGSILELYPGFSFSIGGAVAILCMIVGFAISVIFGKKDMQNEENKIKNENKSIESNK